MASIDTANLVDASDQDRVLASTKSPNQRALLFVDVPVGQLAGRLLAFVGSLVNLANINVSKEVVTLDSQVLAKLVGIASAGLHGGLGLLTILFQAASGAFRRHVVVSSVILYILVNGFFENVIFSTIAGTPMLLWAMSMAWHQIHDCNQGKQEVQSVPLGGGLA